MTSILEIILEESDEAELQAKRDADYRQKVIDAFFEYGKLKGDSGSAKERADRAGGDREGIPTGKAIYRAGGQYHHCGLPR